MQIALTDFHFGGELSLKSQQLAGSLGYNYVDPTQIAPGNLADLLIVIDPNQIVTVPTIFKYFNPILSDNSAVIHVVASGACFEDEQRKYIMLGIYPPIYWNSLPDEIHRSINALGRDFLPGLEIQH